MKASTRGRGGNVAGRIMRSRRISEDEISQNEKKSITKAPSFGKKAIIRLERSNEVRQSTPGPGRPKKGQIDATPTDTQSKKVAASKSPPISPQSDDGVVVKRRGRPPKTPIVGSGNKTAQKSMVEVKSKTPISVSAKKDTASTPASLSISGRTKRTPKPNPRYINDDVVSVVKKTSSDSSDGDKGSDDEENSDFKMGSSDDEFEVQTKKVSQSTAVLKRKSPSLSESSSSKINSRRKQSFSTPVPVQNKVGRKRKISEDHNNEDDDDFDDDEEEEDDDDEDDDDGGKRDSKVVIKKVPVTPVVASLQSKQKLQQQKDIRKPIVKEIAFKRRKLSKDNEEDAESKLESFTIVNINDIIRKENEEAAIRKTSALDPNQKYNRRKTVPNAMGFPMKSLVKGSPSLPLRPALSASNSLPTLKSMSTPKQSVTRPVPTILNKSLSARRLELIKQQKVEDEKKEQDLKDKLKARQENAMGGGAGFSVVGTGPVKNLQDLKLGKPRLLNSTLMGRSTVKPTASVIAKIVDSSIKEEPVRRLVQTKPQIQPIRRANTAPLVVKKESPIKMYPKQQSTTFLTKKSPILPLKRPLTTSSQQQQQPQQDAGATQRTQLAALQKLQQQHQAQRQLQQTLQSKQPIKLPLQQKLPQPLKPLQRAQPVATKPMAAKPTIQQQPKFIISRKMPVTQARRMKKVTCYETWYVINMAEFERLNPPLKPTFDFSLVKLGNHLKNLELPSSDWTYKVTLQKKPTDDHQANAENVDTTTKDTKSTTSSAEEYTGDIQDDAILVEDKKNYHPLVITFQRQSLDFNPVESGDDKFVVKFDRTVEFRNRTFCVSIDGKSVQLCGAPNMDTMENVETLLQIVDDIAASNTCLEPYDN